MRLVSRGMANPALEQTSKKHLNNIGYAHNYKSISQQ